MRSKHQTAKDQVRENHWQGESQGRSILARELRSHDKAHPHTLSAVCVGDVDQLSICFSLDLDRFSSWEFIAPVLIPGAEVGQEVELRGRHQGQDRDAPW